MPPPPPWDDRYELFYQYGILANAPVLVGAPGLTPSFEGPPEVLPGGDTVLLSVDTSMVTVLTFQVLLG